MSSTASQLPQELWVQILQYVPNYQRLSACALVCRKLARAAASATTSVELTASQRCAAFLSHWVSSYGSSLTRLHLSADDSSIRDLPCPALLELSLHGGHVQLCAGNEGVGLLHSCTALTRLSLLYPTLLDDGVLMPARGVPSAVAQLRHLALQYAGPAAPDGESKLAQALQHRLLPHLTALTCFQLKNKYGCSGHLVSCFLQHVSTMNRLQRLLVWNAESVDATTLPGIERLTALQDLELAECELQPMCLLSVATGLNRLSLDSVTLQPSQAQQGGALGASQLLQLLARLPALQQLTLGGVGGEWPQQLSLYSALTASSSLQELNINGCNIPHAAWEHVFPAGRKLLNLHTLTTYACGTEANPPLHCADFPHIIRCCPGLRSLDHGPTTDAQLESLAALTMLTRLELGPVSQRAVGAVTGLTQLQHLDLLFAAAADGEDAAAFGLCDLIPLTALSCLTELSSDVDDPQEQQQLGAAALCLDLSSADDAVPDVWVRLLAHCAEDPAAQPAVTKFVLRQLDNQQCQIFELQQQHKEELAASRAEAAELRGRVQVQVLERQQEQVAADRAEAAELRARVQALEGQLQEVLAALRQPLLQA